MPSVYFKITKDTLTPFMQKFAKTVKKYFIVRLITAMKKEGIKILNGGMAFIPQGRVPGNFTAIPGGNRLMGSIPVKTGRLRSTLEVQRIHNTAVLFKVGGTWAPYAAAVHNGTSHSYKIPTIPGTARTKTGNIYFRDKQGKLKQHRQVTHPPTRPQPFMAEMMAILEGELDDLGTKVWKDYVRQQLGGE